MSNNTTAYVQVVALAAGCLPSNRQTEDQLIEEAMEVLADVDRLRAENAALREAGEGLARALPMRYCNCATVEPLGGGPCLACAAMYRYAALTAPTEEASDA